MADDDHSKFLVIGLLEHKLNYPTYRMDRGFFGQGTHVKKLCGNETRCQFISNLRHVADTFRCPVRSSRFNAEFLACLFS
jgi:hypothetical protein